MEIGTILATYNYLSMRKIPTPFFLAGLFLMLFLNGCAAIGLALLGVGASVATGKAISYTLNGIAYRTFTIPLPQLRTATRIKFDLSIFRLSPAMVWEILLTTKSDASLICRRDYSI